MFYAPNYERFISSPQLPENRGVQLRIEALVVKQKTQCVEYFLHKNSFIEKVKAKS
jgi:hypothetical protein